MSHFALVNTLSKCFTRLLSLDVLYLLIVWMSPMSFYYQVSSDSNFARFFVGFVRFRCAVTFDFDNIECHLPPSAFSHVFLDCSLLPDRIASITANLPRITARQRDVPGGNSETHLERHQCHRFPANTWGAESLVKKVHCSRLSNRYGQKYYSIPCTWFITRSSHIPLSA